MRRRMGRPGLVGLAARTAVVAGTANAVSGRSQSRQAASAQQQADAAAYQQQQQAAAMQAAAAQAVAAQAPPAPAAAPPAPARSTDDLIASLERLGSLHAQGILTDEEFAAQKARILA